MKIGTLFSGAEGVSCGAKAAGIHHAWGIEYDDAIASVARMNGFNVTTADVTKVSPADFAPVDILHASPPCPNFSVAKAGGKETGLDIALAQAVCNFIAYHRPTFVTIENVWGYRKSESWQTISSALADAGYCVAFWRLNAADYGAPQTRKRMIVIARRDGVTPERPKVTHAKQQDLLPLLDDRSPWVGWYESIDDLIPTFLEGEFAPWQKAYIPDILKESTLFANGRYKRGGMPARLAHEPAFTITSNVNQLSLRAFIVGDIGGKMRPPTIRFENEPSFTIAVSLAGKAITRAYISGKVVILSMRALARLQSFPDWYELPENKRLAGEVIGNAVPPLLYQRIVESVLT